MRKTALLVAFVLSVTFFGATAQDQKSFKDLIGKWNGTDQTGKNGGLEFADSTKVILSIADTRMPPADYRADFSKTPAWLDIILRENGQTRTLRCIIAFVSKDELNWAFALTGPRAKKFGGDSTIIFIPLKRTQ